MDTSEKALRLVARTIDAATAVMDALRELALIETERANVGLDFTDTQIEALIAGGDDKHVDGTLIQSALTSGGTVLGLVISGFHDDNFDKVRR